MLRTRTLRLCLAAIVAALPMGNAFAQTPGEVVFELRPHCVETDHAAAEEKFGGEVPKIDGIMNLAEGSTPPCPSFPVRDPLSKQTDILKIGDTLDMDLVMHNPKRAPIKRFRVWFAYDSNVLEGTTLELSDTFAIPTPGEGDFSSADNYVKVSASSEDAVDDDKVVLARIVFTVKSAPANGVILAFYDPTGTATAHTGAFTAEGETETNVAATVQGSLAVRFAPAASSVSSVTATATGSTTSSVASSVAPIVPVVSSSSKASVVPVVASSASTTSAATTSSSSSVVPVVTVFSKLQVQALRVTTEGSSAFLAWNPLPSTELAGYNLYYGSISGRYLQRRSIDKESQTITIRALPVGIPYYFAVRAMNASGTESDFSQEVAVTIGNPATSTSPLSGNLIEGPQGQAPDTGGTVAGDSGPGSWIAAMVGISAVLGTAFAFRRQWTASSVAHQ